MLKNACRGALAALATTALLAPVAAARPKHDLAAPAVPYFSHVVEVVLENESATATFENPGDTVLQALKQQGLYIPGFYGVGHASLGNYEAAFSAEQPTTQGKADCAGMPYSSCIFPASVPTFGTMLNDRSSLDWKVYSEGETGAPAGHNCLHALDPRLPDPYQGYATNGYATRHNPAPWFASVTGRGGSEAYCQAHSVDLTQLNTDLQSGTTLPAYSFVEPDTCHDGHDDQSAQGGCALDPEGPTYPSGVAAIDAWLPGFVKQVTSAPAWDSHSLLVITFDEGAGTDSSGCTPCGDGSAGGRTGALLISPLLTPGATSAWQGDHYSLLRTWETAWGLPPLKSLAVDATAASTVHDGDPGVAPLTGVWK